MSLSWPIGPTLGQIYTSPEGDKWEWNGYGWATLGTIVSGPQGVTGTFDGGATNGLSTLSGDIALGGTFSQNTQINTDSYGYTLFNSLSGYANGSTSSSIVGFRYSDDTKGNDVINIGYPSTQAWNDGYPAIRPVANIGAAATSIFLYTGEGGIDDIAYINIGGNGIEARVIESGASAGQNSLTLGTFSLTNAPVIGRGSTSGEQYITWNTENTPGEWTITDSLTAKGIVYTADYSANYTDRSLIDKQYVDKAAGGTGYTQYRATLTQTGTSAPAAAILGIDTLGGTGGTATWNYIDIGTYDYIQIGAFPDETKVEIEIDNMQVLAATMTNSAFNTISASRIDADTVRVRTAQWGFYNMGSTAFGVTTWQTGVGVTVNEANKDDVLFNTRFVVKVWS